jgi:hypothetical protein
MALRDKVFAALLAVTSDPPLLTVVLATVWPLLALLNFVMSVPPESVRTPVLGKMFVVGAPEAVKSASNVPALTVVPPE